MTCFWRGSQHCSRVSFACNSSAHVNDTHLFVALNDAWIEEIVSFKMSQDFLCQVLMTTFPSAHEADHRSTARFHKSDAWLSFALCSNEHVIRLEGRISAILFTTTRLCGELRPRLATQSGHQSLNGTCVALCAILAASVGGSGVRNVPAVFVSQHKLFDLIRTSDCSSITS